MKITAVLLFVCCMHVGATGLSQTITWSGKSVPLSEVLSVVKEQTGLLVFANQKQIAKARPVTIDAHQMPLKEFMKQILAGQRLAFDIEGNTISVKEEKRKPDLNERLEKADPAPIEVYVRIINEEGDPVAGVTVSVKGTKTANATNLDGACWIKADLSGTLVITAVNIATIETEISGRRQIVVQVNGKTSKLDEIQVIAYGKTTQRRSTGNVFTVKAPEIEKQPINNPLLALQGRVPGLVVIQTTGLPGSGIKVRIQGQNSITRGSDPLYVIDNVPYPSQLLPAITNILGSSGNGAPMPIGNNNPSGNPLSFLNPSDIESIDILKDADATAIYGSRAANGAIIITTKKGSLGKSKTDINIQSGFGKVGKRLKLLNSDEYEKMRSEALKNDNLTVSPTDYDINGFWNVRNVDWQKQLIGGTAKYWDSKLSHFGSEENLYYNFGAGYHKETTVFPGTLNDQRISAHLSLTKTTPNKKFKITLSSNFMNDRNFLQYQDITSNAVLFSPNSPAPYTETGAINWMPNADGTSTWINPFAAQYAPYNTTTNNLLTNLSVSYQILAPLSVSCSFGYSKLENKEVLAPLDKGKSPEELAFSDRYSMIATGGINNWLAEPQITFKKNIGKTSIEALIGMSFQETKTNREELIAIGFNSDLVLEDIKSASAIIVNSTLHSEYKYSAGFTRLNLNYADKYIINFSGRRDGSSRFGQENMFNNFYSIGAGWIFTKETGLKPITDIFSFGKIRISYGSTGNDQIGDYQFLSLYNTVSANIPYRGSVGLRPNSIANPYLQWEKTNKFQVGLDLGILNDRVLLSANFANNRSSNQLLTYVLPITTGFSNISSYNFPATIRNNSWEFSLNADLINSKRFSWHTSVNLTLPNNKLLSFDNFESSGYKGYFKIGSPITGVPVYNFAGVNRNTGLFEFFDKDGKTTSNPNYLTDRYTFINTSPTLFGGIQETVRFNSFELNFLLQFVKQKGKNYRAGNYPGASNINQPTTVLNAWKSNTDNSPQFQKYAAIYSGDVYNSYAAADNSTFVIKDASFARLKNASLYYSFPSKMRAKLKLSALKLFVQGQNLLTFTKYVGLDPESLSAMTLPPLRIITFGIQVSF